MTHAAAGALLCGTLGCASYHSTYVPPADGRARPVLQGNDVVMSVSAPTQDCLAAALDERAPVPQRWTGGAEGWRVNLFFVRPVIVLHAGTWGWPHGEHVASGGGASGVASGHGGSSGGGASSSGGAHGGGGTDWGKLGPVVVILAVAALTTLPIVADVFSLLSPSGGDDADAVDHVNAWNDYVRATGSACAAP